MINAQVQTNTVKANITGSGVSAELISTKKIINVTIGSGQTTALSARVDALEEETDGLVSGIDLVSYYILARG